MGKILQIIILYQPQSGSPPHTWGKSNNLPTTRHSPRFTPTYVGKIQVQSLPEFAGVRFTPTYVGKMEINIYSVWIVRGSPPHTWGKFERSRLERGQFEVHPHIRGENPNRDYCYIGSVIGSPPHTWGKFCNSSSACFFISVHPHIRGENDLGLQRKEQENGSPPHTWGKFEFKSYSQYGQLRFTPTYVGKMK
mgnify:CR=1 FL=1